MKVRKRRIRCISVLLSMLLVIQMVTMYAGAEEIDAGFDAEPTAEALSEGWTTDDFSDTDSSKDPLIFGEIDALRDESIEHYRMEDGESYHSVNGKSEKIVINGA